MIDELAKAVANWDDGHLDTAWPDLTDWQRENYRACARAIIDRLMEPSDKMVNQASGYSDFCFVPGVIETVDDYRREIRMIFRTMLDEAKK